MSYSKNCKGGCLFYFAEKPQSIYCTNFPLTRKIRSNDTGLICKMWLRWQGHSFTVSTWQNSDAFNVNETHREKLCLIQFRTRIFWNKSLVAADLFHMLTQSIKFYTFHCMLLSCHVQVSE